jgi:hypothetical protein
MTEMQPPTLESMIDRQVYEHEVFLSFINDSDAAKFIEPEPRDAGEEVAG